MDDILEANAGRLNIGCGPRLSPYIIPRILPQFLRLYPEVQVNLFEYERPVLEQKLITGNLDLVFTTMTNPPNKGIDFVRLYDEEIMLITPNNFQPNISAENGSKKAVVQLESLREQPFVLLKTGHQMRKHIDRLFEESGFLPKIVLETDSAETCLRLVECGIACTILPVGARMIPENTPVKLHSMQPRYYRNLCICNRKGGYMAKTMKLFVDLSIDQLGCFDITE
jgi:DNA-binding transcriptional LysR family regulator